MTKGMMYFPRMLDKIRLHLQVSSTKIIKKTSAR
jgi:hypothetical protein